MSFFENTTDFQELFEINESNYYDPISLGDRKVAFSIKRNYPDDIRYKPAKTKSGDPDNVAAIWVIYTHPDESKRKINRNKVPIRIRVANMSLFRINHFDYDFGEEKSPTEESLAESLSTPGPIDLEYSDEYFFDHEESHFIDRKNRPVSGIEILNQIFSDHCDTTHWVKGLNLRSKLLLRSKGVGLVSLGITFFEYLLKILFGRTLDEDDSTSSFYRGYKLSNLKKLNEDSLNVFGYKAAKHVIVIFCIIIIGGSVVRYLCGSSGGYLGYVGSSNFLSVTHGLFFLWVLDVLVPIVLFWAVNFLIWFRKQLLFLKI